mgnify:CR=1 FL=1
MTTRPIFIILFSISLLLINYETSSANFLAIEEKNNFISSDYLDFSYISFVIQMIIGGAVAGVVTLIAYYRKLSDFIFKLFNRNKKNNPKE